MSFRIIWPCKTHDMIKVAKKVYGSMGEGMKWRSRYHKRRESEWFDEFNGSIRKLFQNNDQRSSTVKMFCV